MANLPDNPVDVKTAVKVKVTEEDLERITLRIGTAGTDETFEECLRPLIVPVLGQLGDSTESIRKKILELLTHINRRLRSRPQVQLPIEALLQQYNHPNESFFVTNFSHIYIKMGFCRLPKTSQLKLISTLFLSLTEDKPVVQKDTLLHLTLPILGDLVINDTNKKAYETIPKKLYKYALYFYTLVLLVPYSFQRVKKTGEEHAFVAVGMSEYDYARIMPTNPNQESSISTPEDLQKAKVGIVKFLSLRVFPAEDIIVPMIVACSDTRHPVVSLADKEVKPLAALVDWESKYVLNEILDIYLARERDTDPKGRVDAIRLPPSVSLRMKLIPFLMKSKITFPNEMTTYLIDCAFDAMEDTTQLSKKKLVSLGLDLILSASRSSSILSESLLDIVVRLDGYLYSKTPPEDGYLKVKAFHVFGEILCKDEMLLLKDIEIVRKLFNALAEDYPPDVKTAIHECLCRLTHVYQAAKFKHRDILEQQLLEMEKVLYENIEKEDPLCRLVSVHYANEIYPPDHISTRYLILQALGDKEDRVRSEAKQAFGHFQADSILMDIIEGKVKLPDFVDFVNHDTKHSRQNPFVQVDRLIPVVEFIRLCLLSSTVGLTEAQINMPYEEDEFRFRISRNIRAYMSAGSTDSPIPEASKKGVDTYFRLIQVVIFTKTSQTPLDFPKYLEEALVGNAKDLITSGGKQLFERMNSMLLLTQRGASSRHACASVYSLVTLETETPESVVSITKEMIDKIPAAPSSPNAIEDQHALQGNALGAAHLVERLAVKQKGVHGKGKMNLIPVVDKLMNKLDGYLYAATCLSPSTNNPTSTMACNELSITVATLLSALQCLCQSGALAHLPVGKPGHEEPWMSKAGLIKKLIHYIRPSQSPIRVKEAALKCLSALCTSENNFCHSVFILQTLMETHTIKDVDFHMSMGQCIVNILLGSSSPYKGQWFERQYPPVPLPKKCGQREMNCVLTRVQELLAHSSPLARQAAAAWVLVILRKLGIHTDMHLSNLQTQLMCLLGDRDETTQDIACQAITMLFDLCPQSHRDSLVSEMVSVLTNGKKRRTDKSDDTESLASGESKSEDGNLVTYKELCSLATSLNQPELIYSFLSLASIQSEWANRRGVASGLVFIARKMGALLKPFLPKLVPKLYRYQFDPHVKVQLAMTQIWNVISNESSSSDLIEEFFREVFNELNAELKSHQPRVRESCCLAVRDLLRHGCAYSLMPEEMGGLFETVFALMDDTKWPVRKAAETTAHSMRKFCLNICEDPNHRESLPPLLLSVVPVLVEKGLSSSVAQIRSLSLEALLAMVRHGRESLRPVIPELVIASLQALTALEPAAYNEFSQLLAGRIGEEAQEKLDQSRAAASMHSLMAEILRLSARYIDEETLDKLIVPLTEVIRHGMGLGTRFGCGHFLTQLAAQCGSLLAPHTGKLLAALLHGVLDKNKVVQKSMANSIGSLVGFAKSTSVEKLLLRVKAWYFEKEDSIEYHRACCYVFRAIGNSATDTIQRHMSIVTPIVFVAKQTQPKVKNQDFPLTVSEENEELLKIWEEVWIEVVPSESQALERHHEDVVALIVECFNSQSWNYRVQATLSLNSLMESCSQKSLDVWQPLLVLVSDQLVQSGRMWQGKHHLLKSVMIVVSKLKSNELISATEDHHDNLIKNMFKEVKRDDPLYQCFAYNKLGFICDVFKKDHFAAVYHDIKELFNKMVEENSTNGTSELLASIGYFWPKNKETQKEYLKDTISLLLGVLDRGVWMHQFAALVSIKQIFSKLHPDLAPNSDDVDYFLPKVLDTLKTLAENCKHDSIRLEIIHFISVAIKYKSISIFQQNWDKILSTLTVFTKDKSLSSNVLSFANTISKNLSKE